MKNERDIDRFYNRQLFDNLYLAVKRTPKGQDLSPLEFAVRLFTGETYPLKGKIIPKIIQVECPIFKTITRARKIFLLSIIAEELQSEDI